MLCMYVFVRQLKLHEFNYTVITYGYFGIQSWDKDHSAQHQPANPMIYKYLQKTDENIRIQNYLKLDIGTPHMIRNKMVSNFCKFKLRTIVMAYEMHFCTKFL